MRIVKTACQAVAMCLALAPVPRLMAHDPGLSVAQLTTDRDGALLEMSMNPGDASAILQTHAGERARLMRWFLDGVELFGDARPLPESGAAVDVTDSAVTYRVRLSGAAAKSLEIALPLLRDLPPGHRQYLTLRDASGAVLATRLLSAQRYVARVDVTGAGERKLSAPAMIWQGVIHIVAGYDHLAFVAVLFLGVLIQTGRGPASAGLLIRRAALVITAFTLAHSFTLGLAAMNYISLPAVPVEAAIAASVVAAALMNLYSAFSRDRFLIAFAFGLIHGFGFAGALQELSPMADSLSWVLVALFNVGVELGQIAVLVVGGPILYLAMRYARREIAARLTSACIGCLGAVWFVQRLAGAW